MPSWWSDIGGASAISRWSAVFTAAFIIPSAVWTATYSSLDMGTAFLVEFVAAAAALPFLWLAHATWLSPHRIGQRHRTLIALLTFFAVGLVRLFVMFGTRAAFDIEQPWSPLQALLTGGVYSVVVLSTVAVVVDAVRSHADLMTDMRQAEQTLARARQLDADEAEALQRAYAEEVLREVRSGIERLAERHDRVAMAEDLRTMSEELVRAGSHSLRDGDVVSRAVAAPRSRVRLADIVRDVRPAAPVLGPIGFEALVFTAVLRDLGSTIAIVNAVVATLAFIGCNLILQRVSRRHWPRRWRFLTLAAINLGIGLLGGVLVVSILVAVLGEQVQALWVGSVTYAVFMLFFSLVSSLRREQRHMERALAASLADQAEELGRVRQLVADQRVRLAHLMHGGLQAELTASALTLSREWGALEPHQAPEAVVAQLLAEIDRQQKAMDATPTALDLEDLFDTWRLAMDLEVDCSPEVSPLLAVDAEMRGRVIDVLSEALTNVVRHGDVRRAGVTITAESEQTILLMVRNPGRLTQRSLGLGSEEMTERGVEWSRTQEGEMVVLRASLSSAARAVG
jgi:signal transduction histidine kinase